MMIHRHQTYYLFCFFLVFSFLSFVLRSNCVDGYVRTGTALCVFLPPVDCVLEYHIVLWYVVLCCVLLGCVLVLMDQWD